MMRHMAQALALSGLMALLIGCATGDSSNGRLQVEGGAPVVYQNDLGEQVVARYFQLSDGSLHFVKLVLPGGAEFTLPQAMSASGVRYTDDRALVWWTRGDTAAVEARDEDGQWFRLDQEFRIVPQAQP